MFLTVLPLDAQAAVSEEITGLAESVSESSDPAPEEPAEESAEEPSEDPIPELSEADEPSENQEDAELPELPALSEEPLPEDQPGFLPDVYIEGEAALASTQVEYQVADDGAYITFDTETGSVVYFHAATGEGKLDMYDIVIPSAIESVPVTKIGRNAFGYNHNIRSVELPSTVNEIGISAFTSCDALESVNIPAGVTVINNYAFSSCSKLSSIVLPETVTEIGDDAFSFCTALEKINIPSGVTAIGSNAFRSCKALTSIELPAGLQTLGEYAFSECKALEAINIPGGLSKIEANTFSHCYGITFIEIPNSVTSIGTYAFGNCQNLEAVKLPESLTSIGDSAFENCTALKEIDIPDSVTSVGKSAFSSCSALVSAKLPKKMSKIPSALFHSCRSLSEVTMPVSCPIIDDTGSTDSNGETTDENGAFAGCEALKHIDLPSDLTYIGRGTFENAGLLYADIPETVKTVGYGAFNEMLYAIVRNPDAVLEYYYHIYGTDRYSAFYNTTVIYGFLGSTAAEYCEKYGNEFRDINSMEGGRIINVNVVDKNGESLEVSFRWYGPDGAVLSESSNVLFGEKDSVYSFEIVLPTGGNKVYKNPGIITVAADETNITVTVEEYEFINLTGKVTGSDGKTVGARITAAYKDGEVSTSVSYDGTFSMRVPKDALSVSFAYSGYYTKRAFYDLTDAEGESYDIGTVQMTATVKDRIILNLTAKSAVADGEEADTQTLSGLNGFDVQVLRNGMEISSYEIQGTSIIFRPYTVSPNETLTVSITDRTGKYAQSEKFSVTLDDEKTAVLDVSLTEKGSFVIDSANLANYNVMLFGADGKLCMSALSHTGTAYDPLDGGSYTLAVIAKNGLITSAPALSYLEAAGLVAGTDYYKKSIAIEDGKITKLSDVNIPALDESKFSYTVPESASLMIYGTSAPAQGTMFMLRGAFTVDPAKKKTPSSIRIVLPEGIEPTNIKSANLNSVSAIYSYDSGSRTIKINCGESDVKFFLYAVAAESGDYDIAAYLDYADGAVQPIGTAAVTVAESDITVPEQTGKEKIIVSGKTIPGALVTVYDNGEKIGEATANAVGSWITEASLAGPVYSYSYHFISAEIKSDVYWKSIWTDEKLVVYDENNANLDRIVMHYGDDYGEHELTIYTEGLDSNKEINYLWYPSKYPTMTFEVYYSNTENIQDVYVITENSAGEEIYIKTVYDEALGAWVGSHYYSSSFDAPVKIYALYVSKEVGGYTWDEELVDQIEKETNEFLERAQGFFSSVNYNDYTVENFNPDTQSADLYYTNPATEEKLSIGKYVYDTTPLEENVTPQILEERGYIPVESGDQMIYITAGADDFGHIYNEYVNPETNERVRYTLETAGDMPLQPPASGNWTDDEILSNLMNALDLLSKFCDAPIAKSVGKFTNAFSLIQTLNELRTLRDSIKGDILVLLRNQKDLEKLVERRCPDNSLLLSNADYYTAKMNIADLRNMLKDYEQRMMNKLSKILAFVAGAQVIQAGAGDLTAGIVTATHGAGAVAWLAGLNVDIWTGNIANITSGLQKKSLTNERNIGYSVIAAQQGAVGTWITNHKRDCSKEPDPRDEIPIGGGYEKIGLPAYMKPEIDPSGYVYEAVPSNRLEGVTAVVSSQAGGVWNAEDYDQINPQITGPDGAYQWFVPEGNWIVNFTKEGYENASTAQVPQAVNGWLPVPPPQLDINVGMISKSAPKVEKSVAFTDQAEILFSQYMDIASVKAAVSLTQDGKPVNVTVEPLNAEYNAEGTVQYATRFKIVPSSGKLGGTVVISASQSALNYASKNLENGYSSGNLTPIQRTEKIVISSRIPVIFHGTASAEVRVEPALEGVTLNIENLSTNIISVGASTVKTDSDGTAVITVTGKLLGAGMLRITEPETGISKDVTVEVSLEAPPEPIVAKLEDGTVVKSGMKVEQGAKIYLSTPTEGATIRYTVDGSCPCEDTALTYSEPIVIQGTTEIRAAALKDGKYSSTVRIEVITDFVRGDVNSDGRISSVDAVLVLRYLANFKDENANVSAMDYNGAGGVTSLDAVLILRHIAGLD